MDRVMFLYIILFIWLLPFSFGEKGLNVCLDGNNHKRTPGPEPSLHSECTPWKSRSCCTLNTTEKLHGDRHYNFDFNHCSNMSEECRKYFNRDTCFYECSPNVGPWIQKIENMKIRRERFYKVPLCLSDCNAWFEACQNDWTCTNNWIQGFNWSSTNKCLTSSKCETFTKVFGNATNFCEKVWDDSWEVVLDDKLCMKLGFDGTKENPNDAVAQHYWHFWHSQNTAISTTSASQVLILFFIFNIFCTL